MRIVQIVVFRYLTDADFFNMYKPSGTEVTGGGQSYIDFQTGAVTTTNWQSFFAGLPCETRANGPRWTFPIRSLGLNTIQNLTIFQRRPQSFSISSQKVTSLQSNRVQAWHPDNGFPQPVDPTNRTSCPTGLSIYIVKTSEAEYWAGWFQMVSPCRDAGATQLLQSMLPASRPQGFAGFILPASLLYIDELDPTNPFFTVPVSALAPTLHTPAIPTGPSLPAPSTKTTAAPQVSDQKANYSPEKAYTEEEIIKNLFDEDEANLSSHHEAIKQITHNVRVRNAKAVKGLKELYHGKCQISCEDFAFLKKDGTPYSEAHHLIPLGDKGADSPFNIIIVNPLIHRMLHYANVSGINLAHISKENTLHISINGKDFTITWHPKHAEYVKSHQDTG